MTPDFHSPVLPASSETSAAGPWTRAMVSAVVQGRIVNMRDRAGNNAPVPAWLAVEAAEVQVTDWTSPILNTHPLDRAKVATAWQGALKNPGEAARCIARHRRGGALRWSEFLYVDLTGFDDLAILICSLDKGPAQGLEKWDELESRFEFASTPMTLAYLDPVGTHLWIEGSVHEIYGCSAEDLIGHPGLSYVDEQYKDAIVSVFVKVITEPGHTQSVRGQLVRPDGTRCWVEATFINRLEDARISAVISLTHDITELLRVEQERLDHHDQLRRSHEEFETLANQVPAAVFRADGNGDITFANRQWHRLVGDVGARNLRDVISPDDRYLLEETLAELCSSSGSGEASLEVRSLTSEQVFSLSCQAVGDAVGAVIGSMADVTSATKLLHLTEHDSLTGLLNRSSIERQLNEALADDPASVVVAFIDLDGFKAVNDECGHEEGDEVLRSVADRLRDAMRPSDSVARFGGDEFVILCRQASPGAESAVAARIEAVFSAPIQLGSGQWQPRASLGFARPIPGENLAGVLRRADEAMYAVKRERHAAVNPRSGGQAQ